MAWFKRSDRFAGADRKAHARAALEREVVRVAAAAPGSRNNALNCAAYNLGRLVAEGLLSKQETIDALTCAGLACGLGVREAEQTVRLGLDAGHGSSRGGQSV